MKNLMLIRHGKSNWDIPYRDIDRPLDQKGFKEAHLVSINIKNYLPDTYVIWSSVAKRAVDTSLIFAQNIDAPIESIIFMEQLYTFDDKQLEKIIKTCDNSFENIILFGHNDAITNFVNKFGTINIDNVPTSSFVSIEFDTNSWSNIKKGVTKKIITPKDLK